MAIDLKSIENFGAIDADEDALLRECFRDHPAYTAAKHHARFLVVGRKGSGKTAIFKRLITERDPAVFATGTRSTTTHGITTTYRRRPASQKRGVTSTAGAI